MSEQLVEPPADLPADAARIWRALAPSLAHAGRLDPATSARLAEFCRARARARRLAAELGLPVEGMASGASTWTGLPPNVELRRG